MFSLAYAVFGGNVGNASRQRAQLLIFYFIFVAVGYVLMQEKRQENTAAELTWSGKLGSLRVDHVGRTPNSRGLVIKPEIGNCSKPIVNLRATSGSEPTSAGQPSR